MHVMLKSQLAVTICITLVPPNGQACHLQLVDLEVCQCSYVCVVA